MDELKNKLAALAAKRQEITEQKSLFESIKESLEDTPIWMSYASARDILKRLAEDEAILTEQVKKEAIRTYVPEQGKKLADGLVTIQDSTKLAYDEQQVIEWCRVYMPACIETALRRREFEAEAKKLLESKLQGEAAEMLKAKVQRSTELNAKIAGDLSGLLTGSEMAALKLQQLAELHKAATGEDDIPF